MDARSGPSRQIKPPQGLIEANRKLDGLPLLKPPYRLRRLRQSLQSLRFAIVWAESTAATVETEDTQWLVGAVSDLRRAECGLRALTVEAEQDAPDWERGLSAIRDLLADVLIQYAAPASMPGGTPTASPVTATSTDVSLEPSPRREPLDVRDALLKFQAAVQGASLVQGLAFLVGLTNYRFAGIWRFERGDQTALAHCDRQDPGAPLLGRWPGTCSGCLFMHSRVGVKTLDELLGIRGKRRSRNYHSVPIIDSNGELLATLCLHDTVVRNAVPGEAELLDRVAAFLAERRALLMDPAPSDPLAC
jgi:hypothetical protein